MGHDIPKLYSQGRAKSPTELWSPEENDALHMIISERNLPRDTAADYIRNGVVTLADYDKAVKAKFVPKTLEDTSKSATEALKSNKFATQPKKEKVGKAKKAADKKDK